MDNDMKERLTGSDNLKLSEVMRRIDENAAGILFLSNSVGVLVGCITDGDIRRYLLSGGKMSDDAVNASNKSPRVANSMEEAKYLYHQKNYIIIPIVDDGGRIVDYYCGNEKVEHPQRSPLRIPVVINAGGKGTRLDPFTRVLPKPLIPVGDLPIIELIMSEFQRYSCEDFSIIVNYKRGLMKAYFADNVRKYDINWYDEDVPLGTGGGLSLLKGKLDTTFFFSNCDALLTANYESILRFHKENHNDITMVCVCKNIVIPYGVVEMGVNGVVENMKEKPLMSFLTNTGFYVVEPSVIEDIKDGEAIDFPDVIEREKRMGKRIAVFPVGESDWMDMGQFSELEKMTIKLDGN